MQPALIVVLSLHASVISSGYAFTYRDKFEEKLLIKPLASGHIYSQFKFSIEQEINPSSDGLSKHFRLFPRSFGEIVSKHSVQELHFSLTQGLWQYENWGYPFRDSPSGVELWAWFKPNTSDVSSSWQNLASVLSGQFCASLNFIDNLNTVTPVLSFRPEGAVDIPEVNSTYVRYATLPREAVCTENLTPFKKLLPCDNKAGLTTLLNSAQLFGSHYLSLAVDYKTVCKDSRCTSLSVQLVQSVAVVFDSRVHQRDKQDWSFFQLFGSSLGNTCPLSTESFVFVDISSNKTGVPFSLSPHPTKVIKEKFGGQSSSEFAVYDLKKIFQDSRHINIAAAYKTDHVFWLIPPPVLYANRYVKGYGLERGGIHCTIYNNKRKPLRIIYMDVIPWFMRTYLHTLKIKAKDQIIEPEYVHYLPAKDRVKPYHLEIVMTLPPLSEVEISLDFDRAFLKWTEYAPDAHHGFYAGPAVISAVLNNNRNFTYFPLETSTRSEMHDSFVRIHTQILLVALPTPDFSMPYNVICLACTVVALAFGPIHNLTTKVLHVVDEEEEKAASGGNRWLKALKSKLKNLKQKLWAGEKLDDADEPKKDR